MEIILASASPRRKEILSKAGYKLKIMPSNYEEQINGLHFSAELIENCAYQKALDIKNRIGDIKLIVSADTVVVNNNLILGKPKDKNEAYTILSSLSNKTHFVASAICLIYQEEVFKTHEKTFVTFRKLSKTDILNYIDKYQPFDKAGSYGIQDIGFDFVDKIEGPFDNVVGFPLELFEKTLKKFKHLP